MNAFNNYYAYGYADYMLDEQKKLNGLGALQCAHGARQVFNLVLLYMFVEWRNRVYDRNFGKTNARVRREYEL